MKRKLLAGIAAAVIAYGSCQPAYALFGIGDVVFDPTVFEQVQQSAQQGIEELKWLGDLYGDAQKTIQQLTAFYNLFAHITDATQLAQVLNSEFLHSPMLADALQLEQVFNGRGLTTNLAGKIQALVSRLQYYKPSDQDFAGFHLNQRTTATAGQWSSAQDAYNAETDRVAGLRELMNGINTADPKRVQDIGARATIEVGTIQAQSNRLLAAQIMQQAQQASAREQAEQAHRFSVDQLAIQAHASTLAANNGQVNLIGP